MIDIINHKLREEIQQYYAKASNDVIMEDLEMAKYISDAYPHMVKVWYPNRPEWWPFISNIKNPDEKFIDFHDSWGYVEPADNLWNMIGYVSYDGNYADDTDAYEFFTNRVHFIIDYMQKYYEDCSIGGNKYKIVGETARDDVYFLVLDWLLIINKGLWK